MASGLRTVVLGSLGGVGGVVLARHFLPDVTYVETSNQAQQQQLAETNSLNRILKYGVPSSAVPTLLQYDNHVLEYDPARRVPKWVAEHVSKSKAYGETANRKLANFVQDPQIPIQFSAQNTDFWGSGWSRGHMAPAGNNKHSQSAMNQTFYLSNIVPQDLDNNGNYWNRLEIYCRELTNLYSDVYIISGPLWLAQEEPVKIESSLSALTSAANSLQDSTKDDSELTAAATAAGNHSNNNDNVSGGLLCQDDKTSGTSVTSMRNPNDGSGDRGRRFARTERPPKKFVKYEVIGNNHVAVPTHLFKVILVEDKLLDRPMLSAFIIPNQPIQDVKLEDFEVDLTKVEQFAGVRFHQNLDKTQVDKLCFKTGCSLNNYKEFQEFFWKRRLNSPWNLRNLQRDWKTVCKKGLQTPQLEELYLAKKSELLEKERVARQESSDKSQELPLSKKESNQSEVAVLEEASNKHSPGPLRNVQTAKAAGGG